MSGFSIGTRVYHKFFPDVLGTIEEITPLRDTDYYTVFWDNNAPENKAPIYTVRVHHLDLSKVIDGSDYSHG